MNMSTMNHDVTAKRWSLNAITLATVTLIAGCAVPRDMDGQTTLRVEPLYRVRHSEDAGGADAYLALARRYEGEGRSAQALQAYRQAAAIALPGDGGPWHALGLALAKQGRISEAVVALQVAAERLPREAPVLSNLGYAWELNGKPAEARVQYEAALAVDPGYARAKRNLARLGIADAVAPDMALSTPGTQLAALGAPALVTAQVPQAAPTGESQAVAAASPARRAQMTLQSSPSVAPLSMAQAGNAPASNAQSLSAVTVATASQPSLSPLRQAESTSSVQASAPLLASDPPPRADLSKVRVEVFNGNGVTGAAANVRRWLADRDVRVRRLDNLLPYNTQVSQVRYRPGKEMEAQALARLLPIAVEVVAMTSPGQGTDLRVVLGRDLSRTSACALIDICGAPSALNDALRAAPGLKGADGATLEAQISASDVRFQDGASLADLLVLAIAAASTQGESVLDTLAAAFQTSV